jgi:hypothetical protein
VPPKAASTTLQIRRRIYLQPELGCKKGSGALTSVGLALAIEPKIITVQHFLFLPLTLTSVTITLTLISSFSNSTASVTMADSAFNPGLQPNFPRMAQLQRDGAQIQRDFAEECERIPNVPQLTMGNDILEALRQSEGRLGERIDTISQRITELCEQQLIR